METPAFDSCLRVLGYWDAPDSSVRDELVFEPENFPDKYVQPFRRELYKKIIDRKKPRIRKDLIRFYIEELNKTAKYIEKYIRIEPVPIYDENQQVVMMLTDGSSSIRFAIFTKIGILYKAVFDEIQYCCQLYEIPFHKVCKEVNFPLITIHNRIEKEEPETITRDKTMSGAGLDGLLITPVIEDDYIEQIFIILKTFFRNVQQDEFLSLLKGERISTQLLFMDSGNRLADAFKQLFNCEIIKGCQKKELEDWIGHNFQYRYRDKVLKFTPRYLSDIVSSNSDKCQKPILNIKKDKATGAFLISKV